MCYYMFYYFHTSTQWTMATSSTAGCTVYFNILALRICQILLCSCMCLSGFSVMSKKSQLNKWLVNHWRKEANDGNSDYDLTMIVTQRMITSTIVSDYDILLLICSKPLCFQNFYIIVGLFIIILDELLILNKDILQQHKS